MDTRILDKGTPRITTLPNLSHPNPGYYTNPSWFENGRKNAKMAEIMNGPWCMNPFLRVERPYLRG